MDRYDTAAVWMIIGGFSAILIGLALALVGIWVDARLLWTGIVLGIGGYVGLSAGAGIAGKPR